MDFDVQPLDGAPAGEDVLRELRRALTRYVTRLLKDPSAAQDVVQEALLRLQTKGQDVPLSSQKAWLYRVARNLVIDMLRRKQREPGVIDPDLLPGEASRNDPSLLIQKKEQQEMLLAKLNELPPRQLEVVRLKFQEGLSYAEIAEVTNQTRSTVGWLLHTAMEHLRREMKDASRP